MAKMIDNECNVEFPSDAAYLVHKKAGHSRETLKGTPIEAPPGADGPSAEFIEQVARIENKEAPPSQHPSELPPVLALSLKYIWTGEHETCRRQPSTIMLEVGDKSFCVAYCDSCKVQLENREVAKL